MTSTQKSAMQGGIDIMSARFLDNLVESYKRHTFCVTLSKTTRVSAGSIKKLNELCIHE